MKEFSNVNPQMLSLAEIREEAYQQGKADGIDDALFVLYDKGYIDSDTEEYVREKLKEQK